MCGWNRNRPGRFLATVVLGTLALLAASCGKRDRSDTGTLRISQRNEPATLDPQQATLPDEFFIIRALAEGLVTPNPQGGQPLPAMAERWESSVDGLVWTFHLRRNARWSDGNPFTAQDVVASLQRVLTPSTAAPRATFFFAIKNAEAFYRGTLTDFAQVGVTAPSPTTLQFKLERATSDFLALVASGPWIPVPTAAVSAKGRAWTQPGNLVGNGRFTLTEWSPNRRIVVRKNPHHWDAAATRLETIEFLAFDSGDTEERAFRAGQVDVTMAVPSPKLETYRTANPPVLKTIPLHETRYLTLNTKRPPLNDPRVRRALSLALDRRVLTDKVLKGGQQPAFTYVPPGLGGYQPATLLEENTTAAQQLLAAAGFPGGKGFPKLELSTWGASTAVLEAIQQLWRERLGLEISLLQREGRVHFAAIDTGDYDLGFWTAIPDYDSPADLLDKLLTGASGNYPGWSDVEYDRLLSGPARDFAAAETRLLHELPLIPLYFNTKNFLLHPRVRGWQEDALWTRYYDHVFLEN